MSVRAFELRQLELSFSLLFLFLFVARLAKSQVKLFIYLQLFFFGSFIFLLSQRGQAV